MAIVELANLIERITGLGDDDIIIGLLEDVSDTFNSFTPVDNSEFETRISELENSLAEVEKTWRQKYIDRFKGVTEEITDEQIIDEPTVSEEESVTINELFESDETEEEE